MRVHKWGKYIIEKWKESILAVVETENNLFLVVESENNFWSKLNPKPFDIMHYK